MKKRNANILIVGERYSQNLGDAVICKTLENIINESCTLNVSMFDLSGRVDFEHYYSIKGNRSYIYTIKAIWHNWDIISALFKASKDEKIRILKAMTYFETVICKSSYDIIVFAGGALFQDFFSKIIYLICKRSQNSKIVFNSIGFGPIDRNSKKYLNATFKLKNIKCITLRDKKAFFDNNFITDAEVIESYDVALCCNDYFSPSVEAKIEYGIGCIYSSDLYLKGLLEMLEKTDVSFRFFSNGDPNDEDRTKRFLINNGYSKQWITNHFLPRPTSEIELINCINTFKKIISFRLHSLVIATSYGIPFITIPYEEKVEIFCKKMELCECLLDNIKEVDINSEMKMQNLELVLEQKNVVKNTIVTIINSLI